MRFEFHDLPLGEPYEYWCRRCRSMNLAFVELADCPVCHGGIIKGKVMELDKEALMNEANKEASTS